MKLNNLRMEIGTSLNIYSAHCIRPNGSYSAKDFENCGLQFEFIKQWVLLTIQQRGLFKCVFNIECTQLANQFLVQT